MKKNLQMRHQGATSRSTAKHGNRKSALPCKSPTPVIVRRPLKRIVAAAFYNAGEKRAKDIVRQFDQLSRLPNQVLAGMIYAEQAR